MGQTAVRRVVTSNGQVIEINANGVPSGMVVDGSSVPGPSSSAATGADEKTLRLTKFKEVKFNRTPSEILKVWKSEHAPDKKMEEPKTETKKLEETTKKSGSIPDGPDMKPQDPKAQELKEAEEKKKQEAEKKAAELKKIEEELKTLQKDVTMSRWDKVQAYLKTFPEDQGKQAWEHLATSLSQNNSADPNMLNAINQLPYEMQQTMRNAQRYQEKPVFNIEDVMGLAQCNVVKLTKETTTKLVPIVQLCLEQGHAIESLIERLKQDTALGDAAIIPKRETARLLSLTGNGAFCGDFLPTPQEAKEKADHDALMLLVEYHLASVHKEKEANHLEQGWETLQAILALKDLPPEAEKTALTKCVSLAPRVRKELGETWLKQSFTTTPERGVIILSTLGTNISQGIARNPQNTSNRLSNLKLQNQAMLALIATLSTPPTPEQQSLWSPVVTLLAENWMTEADISYLYSVDTSINPRIRYDMYGNYYFDQNDSMRMNGRGNIQAIGLKDIMEITPSDTWQALIANSLKPRFTTLMAQLYLKAHEEVKAFPYIEQLAKHLPERAHEQAEEFLRVWIRNHDLNSDTNNSSRYSSYFYVYSYQPRAESIPLTRSQQERNLRELSEWLAKLKKLPIEPLDEKLVVEAFTKCHSSAEVYRIDAIENILGDISKLDDKTLGQLAQSMRGNLATIWKSLTVQQQSKTKRKKEDVQAEVMRGYQVVHELLARSIKAHPKSWQLQLAHAALLHDENAYQHEIDPKHTFEVNRRTALESFAQAAKLYADQIDLKSEKDYSIEVYQIWYFAALGACDVQNINETNRLVESQPALIRAALDQLPEPARKYHQDHFANGLFRTLSGVKPNAKYRYLKAGIEIVGDHPQANEAQKVFNYYKDLVTEIKLETRIDGTTSVGHKEPFGVFVNLRHTQDMERESGGFAKYLQNQNNMYYSYNYGRPNENYRDKFEEATKAALQEHFEVLSITFQRDDIQSRAQPEIGWRVTPYAYVLLKPKGAEIDTLPKLSMDLDFMDTSGYVVLPIESGTVPIDCRPENGDQRPVSEIKVVQTLDERQAKEGKLSLEIKATARGIVPPIEKMVELNYPGFSVVKVDQQPVSVAKFDEEAADNVIVSERLCSINMEAKAGEKRPETFTFAKPLPGVAVKETLYQRYDDADLVKVEPTFTLQEEYRPQGYQKWIFSSLGLLAVGIILAGIYLRPKNNVAVDTGIEAPSVITPFTTIGYLRRIDERNHLADQDRRALLDTITHIEQAFFQQGSQSVPNLEEIVQNWQHKTAKLAT
jgi:hypothetical protein